MFQITLLSVAAATAAIMGLAALLLSLVPALRDNVMTRRVIYVIVFLLGVWGGLVAGLNFPWWTIFVLLGFLVCAFVGWLARGWHDKEGDQSGRPIDVSYTT